MSSYNVKKRSKDPEVKKGQYYVLYLGWKECRGLGGREYTEPIVKDLVLRRRGEDLPKLTIEVGKKELKIFQLIKTKYGKNEKLKFPTVPAKDVTYAVQGLPPDEDVVACIFLGYNPTTRRAVHVHVYRCDSPDTAFLMMSHLMDIVKIPSHQERLAVIEEQLVSRGEIVPRPANFIDSFDADSVISTTPSTVHTVPDTTELSDDDDSGSGPFGGNSNYGESEIYDKEIESNMESLASELKRRLGNKNQVPILLPPQDYDTIRRIRGNLDLENMTEYGRRKCQNQDIVGHKGAILGHKHEPERLRLSLPNGFDDKGSGSSDGKSDGSSSKNQNNFKHVEMRSKPSVSSDDRRSRGSRGSSGQDIQVISPRWKKGHEVYSPPGIPTSPHSFPSENDASLSPGSSGRRRARSPSPMRNSMPPRGRSPSPHIITPGAYAADNVRGRALSPGRQDQPRRRSGSRGRYYDNPQAVNLYPGGGPPQGGRGYTATHGADVVRMPRQQSLEERYPSDKRGMPTGSGPDLSASYPAGALQRHSRDAQKDKKDKKDKKEKKRKNKNSEEPPPDYTMHPAAARKMTGQVYS